MIEAEERAWLAGIFEGEGSIAFTGKNSVCVVIAMTDRDVVERCRSIIGAGRIHTQSGNERRKPLYQLHVARKSDVVPLLELLARFAGRRRGQRITAALERLERCHGTGRCRFGHPMDGDNLYIAPSGQRKCRACAQRRERDRVR